MNQSTHVPTLRRSRRGQRAGPQADRPRRPRHKRHDRGVEPQHASTIEPPVAATVDQPLTNGELDRGTTLTTVSGILELHPKGYGFLRDPQRDCRPTPHDPYVPLSFIRKHGLKPGNLLSGLARPDPSSGGWRLEHLEQTEGCPGPPFDAARPFGSLTPIHPESQLRLETGSEPLSTRVIDLLVPVGKGQRGLIVAPPRSGKTVLLRQIGQAVAQNHPEVDLMVLLIDERPEEVTEMRRSIPGDVFASSLDQDVESHVRLSRLVIDRAKRLAERGRDVVLLIDSLTRMARAFNKWVGSTGRTMSGGLDIRALEAPKQLFATARAFEEGGSLTILATILVETGSRMDDVIFEEFKGTGNLELVLDRRLAEKRIWPAIDISRSGTRREEKLLDPETLQAATLVRRTLSSLDPADAMERLTAQLAKHRSNRAFLETLRGRAA